MALVRTLSTPAPGPHSISRVYSLLQRFRSFRHRFWYGVSERVRWSRGAFHETHARDLPVLTLEQAQRIAALRSRYQVQFESRMNAATSVNNYEYLDMLDRAWGSSGTDRPAGGVVCDVGCASFWYAAALHAFFRPRRLIGVEIEGHRLFRDGHVRIDYAMGYVAQVPNANFVVADYLSYTEPADLITAWFPFLTPSAILAWRLPLSLLQPQRLFRQIHHNLRPKGLFVMVNHGPAEAALAADLCSAMDLELIWRWVQPASLAPMHVRQRASAPVISCWRQGVP
jgi:SAM-dependent methyltransferase